jgi:hypothetical protein
MTATPSPPPNTKYTRRPARKSAPPILPAAEYFAARGIAYPLPRSDHPPMRLRRFCITG